jgi:hypothetical protein
LVRWSFGSFVAGAEMLTIEQTNFSVGKDTILARTRDAVRGKKSRAVTVYRYSSA